MSLELVIMIGLQATGKTTFRRERFDGTHVVVSKDDFRNNRRPERRQRFLIEEALSAGRSVVVDNTNVRVGERAALLEQGKLHSARAIGFFFRSTLEDALRRNAARSGRALVPEVAIKTKAKLLVLPTLAEGFAELYEVRMGPAGFEVGQQLGEER